MGLKKEYVIDFFKLRKETRKANDYEIYLKEAIANFLKDENKETAFDVYVTFFDSYKILLQGKKNFIDLLDVLKSYEENAATLIDKQRDHYVHSVNVFVLGLAIYAQNKNLRTIIEEDHEKNSKSREKYESSRKEFLFKWGIASLCHDVGYPVEITNNQIKKFIKLVSDVDGENKSADPYLAFKDFEVLNRVPTISIDDNSIADLNHIDPNKALDLLSYNIQSRLGTDLETTKKYLSDFLSNMQKFGFVDHGFYSSIILLKWYGHMLQMSGISSDVLYNEIVDAAGAILLHNYYKNVLMKEPFSLGALTPEKHPYAYLLILCDELQEWNREAYGIEDKKRVLADGSRLNMTETQMAITYLAPKGAMERGFAEKKEALFNSVIDIKALFKDGIKVECLAGSDLYIETIQEQDVKIAPRPLLINIEKIAKSIHADYNKNQIERNPDIELKHPTWESLPEDLKYSNIRQARTITDKLRYLGYSASEENEGGTEIKELEPSQIEYLSKIEHDSWVDERSKNGWTYGEAKDIDNKISPHLIPYEELTEDVKELDRDTVRNIISLLNTIGLKVYK
ncbi:MAG: RyR domain-containing protein [Tissierellales bacterium]